MSFLPSTTTSEVMLLAVLMEVTGTLYFLLMLQSESPFATTWTPPAAEAVAAAGRAAAGRAAGPGFTVVERGVVAGAGRLGADASGAGVVPVLSS